MLNTDLCKLLFKVIASSDKNRNRKPFLRCLNDTQSRDLLPLFVWNKKVTEAFRTMGKIFQPPYVWYNNELCPSQFSICLQNLKVKKKPKAGVISFELELSIRTMCSIYSRFTTLKMCEVSTLTLQKYGKKKKTWLLQKKSELT